MDTKSYKIAVCTYGSAFNKNLLTVFDQLSKHYSLTFFNHLILDKMSEPNILNFIKVDKSSTSKLVDNNRINDLIKQSIHHNQHMLKHSFISNSMFQTLWNKKEYEIKNNIIFDLVMLLETSYNLSNNNWINNLHLLNWNGVIRSNEIYKNQYSYGATSINSKLLIGESRYIDIVGRFHNNYENYNIWKFFGAKDLDPAFKHVDLDALMWKWLTFRNIDCERFTND